MSSHCPWAAASVLIWAGSSLAWESSLSISTGCTVTTAFQSLTFTSQHTWALSAIRKHEKIRENFPGSREDIEGSLRAGVIVLLDVKNWAINTSPGANENLRNYFYFWWEIRIFVVSEYNSELFRQQHAISEQKNLTNEATVTDLFQQGRAFFYSVYGFLPLKAWLLERCWSFVIWETTRKEKPLSEKRQNHLHNDTEPFYLSHLILYPILWEMYRLIYFI